MVNKGKQLSLRDILSWVAFINRVASPPPLPSWSLSKSSPADVAALTPPTPLPSSVPALLTPKEAYVHGAMLTLLDGLGIGTGE